MENLQIKLDWMNLSSRFHRRRRRRHSCSRRVIFIDKQGRVSCMWEASFYDPTERRAFRTYTHTAANALDCISVTTCNTEHIVVVVVSQVEGREWKASFVMQTEWTRPAVEITRLWIQLIFCDAYKNNKTAPWWQQRRWARSWWLLVAW